jgi:putative transposase
MSAWFLKHYLLENKTQYSSWLQLDGPICQTHYYDRNLENEDKLQEKLTYIHNNPVRAGLVAEACDWPHSSAVWYEQRQPVGVDIVYP